MTTYEQDKQIIIEAIEALRATPPSWITDNCVRYDDVLFTMSMVQDYNVRGDSVCGMASDVVERCLTDYFNAHAISGDVLRVTSAVRNGTFHHYNVVQIEDHEPLLVDLTAAQFFFKPLDVLGPRPYFVGTRQELKDIVNRAAAETWAFAQNYCPEKNLQTPWDMDFEMYQDWNFRSAFIDAQKEDSAPHLLTESLYYGWEVTWGDISRAVDLKRVADLPDEQEIIPGVIAGTVPEIENLVSSLTRSRLTRADGPRI